MIRINLVTTERDRSKRAVGFDTGQKVTVACTLILVLTVGVIAWQFWTLGRQSQALDDELTAAGQEIQRLATVLEQVRQFDERRAQLQERVALIEQLRNGQAGPVRMLDQLSRSLPDSLWLTEVRQEADDVTVQGRATTLTALSDFVANLESSGHFLVPVEIIDSQLQDEADRQVVRFEVKAKFVLPGL